MTLNRKQEEHRQNAHVLTKVTETQERRDIKEKENL